MILICFKCAVRVAVLGFQPGGIRSGCHRRATCGGSPADAAHTPVPPGGTGGGFGHTPGSHRGHQLPFPDLCGGYYHSQLSACPLSPLSGHAWPGQTREAGMGTSGFQGASALAKAALVLPPNCVPSLAEPGCPPSPSASLPEAAAHAALLRGALRWPPAAFLLTPCAAPGDLARAACAVLTQVPRCLRARVAGP